MRQFLRVFGVAVLAAALLDASAGLCFCHRGAAMPGAKPASHGCCHESGASGTTAVKAVSACCHIEAAEKQATPALSVQFAAPATAADPVSEPLAAKAILFVARVLPGSSPPLFSLRI